MQGCINVESQSAVYSVGCSQSLKASLVPSVISDRHIDRQTDSHTGGLYTLPGSETSHGNEQYDLKKKLCL